MYCILDTETTGLDLTSARAVSIAWSVLDSDFKQLNSNYFILELDNFVVPDRVVKIHGIDEKVMMEKGISRRKVLTHFMADLRTCKLMIGHNMMYDFQIVKTELEKANIPFNELMRKDLCCTMEESIDHCQLPKKRKSGFKFKRPNLQELHTKLFGFGFLDAHNAMIDVNATAACFIELKKLNIIQ